MKGISKRLAIELQRGVATLNTTSSSPYPTPWYNDGNRCLRLSTSICTPSGTNWNENTGAGYTAYTGSVYKSAYRGNVGTPCYYQITGFTPIQFAVATAAWPTIRQMALWMHRTDTDAYEYLFFGFELDPYVTLNAYERLVFLGGDHNTSAYRGYFSNSTF